MAFDKLIWTDAEKALWILENAWSLDQIKYIYERSDTTVWRRPSIASVSPPWMSVKRERYEQNAK